ncbi:hypothetical protein Trydic_g1321 [Trypoxylus dichotomus]
MKVLERERTKGKIRTHQLKGDEDVKDIIGIVEQFYGNLYAFAKSQPPNVQLQNVMNAESEEIPEISTAVMALLQLSKSS